MTVLMAKRRRGVGPTSAAAWRGGRLTRSSEDAVVATRVARPRRARGCASRRQRADLLVVARRAARRAPSSRGTRPAACSAGTRARRRAPALKDSSTRGVGVAERARQLAQHGVADDHRRQLAAGEHVAPDRDRVGGEVLDDALVEALVAAAEQRERRLGGELVDERVVEHPAAGRQRDDAPLRGAGRPGRRRRSARSAASITSTRSTIPAPPPNGVSSTWPPLSGVWSRGLSVAQLVPARERVARRGAGRGTSRTTRGTA